MPEFRRLTEAEYDESFDLGMRAFPMIPPDDRDRSRDLFRPQHTSAVFEDGRLIARSLQLPFGHHLGGRVVPALGVAGVAVDPTIRGRGIGSQMMRWTHDQARADGIPIASLYPATQPIYRNLGYSDAFYRTSFMARLERLPNARAGSATVLPFTPTDERDLRDAYDRFARTQAGVIARDDWWWASRVFRSAGSPQRYIVRENGELTGWMFFEFKPDGQEWRQRLLTTEFVTLTADAGRALLGFAALHRSTCSSLHWTAPISEPLQLLQHDHGIEMEWGMRAMIRVLDLPGAVAARGYARAIDAEVSLAIEDHDIAENRGPWRISVSKGSGIAEPTATSDASCTIQAFGSMYTGLLSPADARRTGGLRADDHTVDALTAMFAGPLPWLSDFF